MGLLGPPDIELLNSRRDSDALLRALRHELSTVRQAAAHALGELGVAAAVPTLGELVQNDDARNVRCTAAQALGDIGNDAASPALASALRDSDVFVRQFAAQALVSMGGIGAVRAVVGALEHDDAEVAEIAADGLAKMAPRDAKARGEVTALLLEALRTTHEAVRSPVARALAALSWDPAGGTSEQQLHYFAGLLRWEQWSELARKDTDIVRAELAGGDLAAFAQACRLLADLGDQKAVEALVVALRALPFGLSRHPAEALDRLGWIPSTGRDKAFHLMARLEPGNRPPALLGLGEDAFNALEVALPHAPETISVVLAALGDPRAVPLLARELDRADSAGKTCRTIIESLARLGGPEARKVLDATFRHGHVEENREAAEIALRE